MKHLITSNGKATRMLAHCAASLVVLAFSACAHYAIDDKPLTQWTPEHDRNVGRLVAGNRSPEMLVLVAFSGGGTRAASFSYGVLQELADTEVMTAQGPRSPAPGR